MADFLCQERDECWICERFELKNDLSGRYLFWKTSFVAWISDKHYQLNYLAVMYFPNYRYYCQWLQKYKFFSLYWGTHNYENDEKWKFPIFNLNYRTWRAIFLNLSTCKKGHHFCSLSYVMNFLKLWNFCLWVLFLVPKFFIFSFKYHVSYFYFLRQDHWIRNTEDWWKVPT